MESSVLPVCPVGGGLLGEDSGGQEVWTCLLGTASPHVLCLEVGDLLPRRLLSMRSSYCWKSEWYSRLIHLL